MPARAKEKCACKFLALFLITFLFAFSSDLFAQEPEVARRMFHFPTSEAVPPPSYYDQRAYCGNGIADPGEECKDEDLVCPPERPVCNEYTCRCFNGALCPNGVYDPGEECGSPGYECPSGFACENCICVAVTPAVCGNGTVESGEECDDENAVSGDGCSSSCTEEICGNGTLDAGEQCDDNNTESGDGCSATCTREPRCGDGYREGNEQCDDGNTESGDGCSSTCQTEPPPPGCGNGEQETGEQCDDGNTVSGDGCSNVCYLEGCGNGLVEPPEECDDNNIVSGDGCSSTCTTELPRCGDGRFNQSSEECDDGNTVSGDGCSETCTLERLELPCSEGVAPGTGQTCINDCGKLGPGLVCTDSCVCQKPCSAEGTLPQGAQCDPTCPSSDQSCNASCRCQACPDVNGLCTPDFDCGPGAKCVIQPDGKCGCRTIVPCTTVFDCDDGSFCTLEECINDQCVWTSAVTCPQVFIGGDCTQLVCRAADGACVIA